MKNIFKTFKTSLYNIHDRISPKAWNEKIRRDSKNVAGVGITVTRPGSGQTEEEEQEEEREEEREEEEVPVRDCLLSVSQSQL